MDGNPEQHNKDGRVVATDLFIDLTCDITERKHHRSVTSVNTQDPVPVPARIPVSAQYKRREDYMEEIEDFEDDAMSNTLNICTFPEPALAKHFT